MAARNPFRYTWRWPDVGEQLFQEVLDGVGQMDLLADASGPERDDLTSDNKDLIDQLMGRYVDGLLTRLEDRDRELEDFLSGLTSGAYPPFDFPGPLVVSASDLFCPVLNTTISQTVWTLASTSTGGASVVVALYKNNVAVDTITIPSGTQVFVSPLSVPIALIGGQDFMSAKITSAGTAAAGLLGAIG